MMALRALGGGDLAAARALLAEALPLDGVGVVAEEKLFGENGARQGLSLGAFAGEELVGVMAQAGRWIKVLAVAEGVRQRGIGTALLEAARQRLGQDGTVKLRVGDHPGNYLSPGVDERYAAGSAFLLARGLREVAEVCNLRVPLQGNPLVTAERSAGLDQAAAGQGYAVRRVAAGSEDARRLMEMVGQRFAAVWAFEISRALGSPGDGLGSGVHAAFASDGAPVAFAAHDGNNRGLGWFGPMGTLPEHRGHGLGEALLLRCLLDVRGRPEGGVIAWVGPVEFYRRTCGALADRRFVVYEEG